ncbi:MAG: AmmeMemoRadiSam system protein B [Actinomycetota bacterium]|nr:AmmeMemoRadiSam system protein B [Actinomycetota bacterium]
MSEAMRIRQTAVAGTWYPGSAGALTREVDDCLEGTPADALDWTPSAIVAPHAGIMFSGPVAAHAYRAASRGDVEVIFLAGPSHYVGFEGVSVWPDGAFASPLGQHPVDSRGAADIMRNPVARDMPSAHAREHSLEMQLPFIGRLLPGVPIVPIVMGRQERATIEALAEALAYAASGRRALLVASTDLSHFFDAERAATLDGRVQAFVNTFDPDGLLALFEDYPEGERGRYVACGGGPAISVMLAARELGAREGRVLKYGHSGEISGDNACVVGYLAAAFGPAETPVDDDDAD